FVAVLRAVDFLAAVLRAVVFLAVLFAVDLRAVVRFAAAGATSCPQPFLGNGTVLLTMLTPLARAFPHLRRCLFRVSRTCSRRSERMRRRHLLVHVASLRCVATQTQHCSVC